MTTTSSKNDFSFLQGGGEMGELTRNYDWSKTSIGAPGQWPQSLRTTLSILLNSKFPMFLWWGHDLVQFYNDAHRPSLGNNGKHPSALGQRGEDCWIEIWAIIKPLIDQVFAGGEATWSEDQLVPIYRNGKLEDVYWSFGCSPVTDESGNVGGVLVVCNETTKKVEDFRNLENVHQQFQRVRRLIEEAPIPMCLYKGRELTIEIANEALLKTWGRDKSVIGKTLIEAVPELEGQIFLELLDNVYTSGIPCSMKETEARIIHNGILHTRYYDLWYNAMYNAAGEVEGLLATGIDVTENVNARKKMEESEQQVRSLIEGAPFPIGVYTGREMRIQFANKSILEVWGKGHDVIGKLYAEVLPELENQAIFNQLDNVFTTGVPFHAKHQRLDLVVDGKLTTFFFNYSFTPLYNSEGKIYGVMNTAADVTDLNLVHQRIEESERNLRNIILQAPVAMCILRGPEHVVEIANTRMFELWGKPSEEMLGKPVFISLPEAKDEGFYELLQNVYTTGETFTANGVPVSLYRRGQIEIVYCNFVYEAYRETNDVISGVMAIATEVTEQVLARQKIEESEERARLAVDSSGLGTYEVNLLTNEVIASPRMDQIFHVEHTSDRNRYVSALHPEDLKVRSDAYKKAIENGVLDYDGRILMKDNSIRWVRIKGKMYYDNENTPLRLLGVVQDITELKEFSEALAKQVKERTTELENKNKELERSNANLEEFAHAASHDLKEPIRKIHFFTDRLKNQLANRLLEEENRTFGRIENATSRMSLLIDDLLLYSHVSHRPHQMEEINLNDKLAKVLDDLEVDILEKKAIITVAHLPVVKGYRRQLQQLFQNLISNALKYSKPGVAPEIKISSSIVEGVDVGGLAGDELTTQYYLVLVEDNGIGFDPDYSERIFKMFHRLHTTSEYQGTGVGLSIARKVVENHRGKILAESTPGKGSTFKVYLPV